MCLLLELWSPEERSHQSALPKLTIVAGYTLLEGYPLDEGIAVVALLLLEPDDEHAWPCSPGRNEPFPASVIDLDAAA